MKHARIPARIPARIRRFLQRAGCLATLGGLLALAGCLEAGTSPASASAPAALASDEPYQAPTVADARSAIASPACTFGVARWGVGDEAGQSNTQTEEKMVQAARYIQPGSRKIVLGHAYEESMPTFPFPTLTGYHLDVPDGTHRVALGPVIAHEELVSSEIGQVGTQMDALGHMCFLRGGATEGGDAECYGGYREAEVWHPKGLRRLGVEKIWPYFTRGILLDVARYANANQRLAPGQAVTLEMVIATMAHEKLSIADIQEGDVVLVRTGHEDLWGHPELGSYYGSTPGIDLEVARFFASRCVGNVGADNWPVEVQPPVDPGLFPVHEYNLTVAGLPQMENLALRDLSDYLVTLPERGRYIFAYAYTPVRLVGATGSPGAPVAIR